MGYEGAPTVLNNDLVAQNFYWLWGCMGYDKYGLRQV